MENKIRAIIRGLQPAVILLVANKLGIFDALAEGPLSSSTLATEINARAKETTLLCNALASLNLLEKKGEEYFISDDAKDFLCRSGKTSLSSYLDLNYDLWGLWSKLEEVIRNGGPIVTMMGLIGEDHKKLNSFVHGMHRKAVTCSGEILKHVNLKGRKNLLDLGGGSGTYALEWVRVTPGLKTVIFDIPPVVEVAKEYIRRYELQDQDRVRLLPGDFHEDPLVFGPYDVVLLANVLQMYSEMENRRLLKKVYDVLEPGGIIIIHGVCVDESGIRPPSATFYALLAALVTQGGNAYRLSQKIDWLKETGFKGVNTFKLSVDPVDVIVGER